MDKYKSYVRVQIWEFGGQEYFKKLFPYYINGTNGVFLVFDLTQIQTLYNLNWWYDKLIEYNKANCPKILIGTKLDLINENSNQFRNDELIIKKFLYTHKKMDFIKTSAKENINIQDCIKEMVKILLDYNNLGYERIL